MLKIIVNIPLFVWPLFAFLLFGGLQARKTRMVPLTMLLLIPAAFLSWSLFSFFGRYAAEPLAIFFWFFCFGVGFFIGFFHMQRLDLRFDKEKKRVKMPGSWIPLALSMSIFASKFSIVLIRSMQPELKGSVLLLGLELFSAIILGIFAGRGVGCLWRYRSSEGQVAKHDS